MGQFIQNEGGQEFKVQGQFERNIILKIRRMGLKSPNVKRLFLTLLVNCPRHALSQQAFQSRSTL